VLAHRPSVRPENPEAPETTLVPRTERGAEHVALNQPLRPGAARPPDAVTMEALVIDTLAVTDDLRARFGQERIYLLGHSWGTALALALWRGKRSTPSTHPFDRLLATDQPSMVPKLEVPVYFLHGSHDRTVSYALAKDYFSRLQACGGPSWVPTCPLISAPAPAASPASAASRSRRTRTTPRGCAPPRCARW